MSTTKRGLDFSNEVLYVGVDVHRRQWTVSLRMNGLELKTFSMNPSPEELERYLQRNYPGAMYRSVYEAGYSGYWIHRQLLELGIDNIVIHAADVPTSHKEKITKSDNIDSRKLVREREHGSLKPLYVPDPVHEHLRSLCRLRIRMVQDQTRLKNRIKGYLSSNGIPLPSHSESHYWSGAFIKWLGEISFDDTAGRGYLTHCTEQLLYLRAKTAELVRMIRSFSRTLPDYAVIERLSSAYGVGFITAVTFYSEIIDIRRFANFDELAAYVGLVPLVTSSGESIHQHGVISRHNRYLRELLIESAWVAIRHDPALTMSFAQLKRRMLAQRAIIRIAKKLLRRLRHVWLQNESYIPGIVA